MELLVFYLVAGLAVLGGIVMVLRPNPLGGAFALIVSLVSVAILFAMLHAEFIFILQILLYGGAIMVLMIFTIMLLNLSPEELKEPPVGRFRALVIFAACGLGAAGFIRALKSVPEGVKFVAPNFGDIESVGTLMLGKYLFPFEVISVLLLVAVVGVVLLAKRVI